LDVLAWPGTARVAVHFDHANSVTKVIAGVSGGLPYWTSNMQKRDFVHFRTGHDHTGFKSFGSSDMLAAFMIPAGAWACAAHDANRTNLPISRLQVSLRKSLGRPVMTR
jgi:hypothetical protein